MDVIAQIDAFISKLPIFKEEYKKTVLGSIACYKFLNTECNFEHLWSKDYNCRINLLSYNQQTDQLFAGTSNGYVYGIQLDEDNNPADILKLQIHRHSIKGLGIDEEQIYSISNHFKVTDIHTQTTHWQGNITKLNHMRYDKRRKRLFILSDAGALIIYSVKNKEPVLISSFSLGVEERISDMIFDDNLIICIC